MKQKFILEKEDLEILRSGGTINLAFAGGKIELAAESKKMYSPRQLGQDGQQLIQRTMQLLTESRQPMKSGAIALALGVEAKSVYGTIYALSKKKLIVGSTEGWRPVIETSATKQKKLPAAVASTNGHAKASSNGR